MIQVESLQVDDYGIVAIWLSDPEINRWLASRWHGKRFDERHVGVQVASPSNQMFLVRYEGVAAGLVSLSEFDRVEKSAGIWYVVDEAYRGRGVAKQSLRKIVKSAFGELGLISLNAWVTEGNDVSRHLLASVGFREVGLMRRASVLDGKHVDRWIYDLVEEDVK